MAAAQSEDPIAAEDPVASDDPLSRSVDDAASPRWTWFGDFLYRAEHTTGLPFNLPDETRQRGRIRAGFRFQATDTLQFILAAEASAGSDTVRIIRIAHDNERINDVNVDQAAARWQVGEHTSLTLGKTPLPLELSPMVWDDVLRPVGLSFEHAVEVRDFDRLVFSGGVFAGDHLYDDESRIVALQAGWRLREGAPTHGAVLLSFLDFDDLDELVVSGLARSNGRVGTRFLSDFRLLDAQFVFVTPLADKPLEARLDLVHNTGADDFGDGIRSSLVWGDSRRAREWELGLSYQRIQRDAVMAAFNSEAWWFHTAARGVMPWVAYGIDQHWRVQLSYFHERPDNRTVYTDRALLDVRAVW